MFSLQGTPDYKDSLLVELEDLVRAAEKEKEKYETLSEKLKNNQHPERSVSLIYWSYPFVYVYDRFN